MREKEVEKKFCDSVKENGGVAYKFVSPGHVGVPDRIVIYPVANSDKKTVAQYIRFAELKAPGKKPRPSQVREHERLKKMGFVVEVIDS